MGKVIIIASGKGGTGKSIFVSNIGTLLALQGYKVVLVDMDTGLRNLDLYMGLEGRVVYNVHDVMTGLCRIKQALIKDKRVENLYLMAASPKRDNGDITPLHMEVLCEKLSSKFDFVLVDSPAGIDDGFVLSAAGAQKAVIITVPEYAAIRDAETVDSLLAEMKIEDRCCVVNKVKAELISGGLVPSLAEIAAMVRVPIAGVIQYDENIHIAANNGLPIVFKKDTYIYENMKKIAARIAT